MREARDYKIAPTKLLGLPWPEWGETDVLLAMARREVDQRLCPCGCGHDVETCRDDRLQGRWQVTVMECHARAELERWQDKNGEKLSPGALIGVRLLAEGEERVDPLAKAGGDEYAELRERFADRLG